MKAGDVVVHKNNVGLGKGEVVSFQVFQGTVLVRWKNSKECSYELPHMVKLQ